MIFTEKERQIINALLEEELNYTMNHDEEDNGVIASYSGSLASILMKLNERVSSMPKNRCFDFMSRKLAARQLV